MAEKRRSVAATVSLILFIAMIHTGLNLHGGNPTFFGTPQQANPTVGVLLVVGALIAAPIVFGMLAGRR